MTDKFAVEIVEFETGNVVHTVNGGKTILSAERIERGVNINLNHEKFHTRIVEPNEEVTL